MGQGLDHGSPNQNPLDNAIKVLDEFFPEKLFTAPAARPVRMAPRSADDYCGGLDPLFIEDRQIPGQNKRLRVLREERPELVGGPFTFLDILLSTSVIGNSDYVVVISGPLIQFVRNPGLTDFEGSGRVLRGCKCVPDNSPLKIDDILNKGEDHKKMTTVLNKMKES
ncbi:hypothetical protein FQN50_000384 [Emmonsiellopsis sp. PD_5]|nr:hypothetical protein FQN50_000384 [Emmonsiellopsis sp. PD_5]